MAYHVGDVVVIRPDLRNDDILDDVCVVYDMEQYCGREAVITEVLDYGAYSIDLDDGEWDWSDSMFCGTKEEYETRNDWNKPFTLNMLDSLLCDRTVCVRVTKEEDAAELFNELRMRGYINTSQTYWRDHRSDTVYWLDSHSWAYAGMDHACSSDYDHLIKYTFQAIKLDDIDIQAGDLMMF